LTGLKDKFGVQTATHSLLVLPWQPKVQLSKLDFLIR